MLAKIKTGWNKATRLFYRLEDLERRIRRIEWIVTTQFERLAELAGVGEGDPQRCDNRYNLCAWLCEDIVEEENKRADSAVSEALGVDYRGCPGKETRGPRL